MLRAKWRRLLGVVQSLEFVPRPTHKRQPPSQHLVQHHAKRIDVGPYINPLGVIELLWGHVRRRPCRHSRARKPDAQALILGGHCDCWARIIEYLRQTKVSYLERAIFS